MENKEAWKIYQLESILRYKKRKRQKEAKKKQRIDAAKKAIQFPNIKGNIVEWVDKNKNGSLYEGVIGDKKFFEISRSAFTFSMKITEKGIKNKKRNFSSIEIIKLQKEAHKVILKNIKFLREIKAIP